MLIQKRVMRTKFYNYVFIGILISKNNQDLDTDGGQETEPFVFANEWI
jgi:hypothetical protein